MSLVEKACQAWAQQLRERDQKSLLRNLRFLQNLLEEPLTLEDLVGPDPEGWYTYQGEDLRVKVLDQTTYHRRHCFQRLPCGHWRDLGAPSTLAEIGAAIQKEAHRECSLCPRKKKQTKHSWTRSLPIPWRPPHA
jgi:hypothetical protein